MIGLDTTVLVAHELKEAPCHQKVRGNIASLISSKGAHFALAPQVLQEFLHVVTDPRRFENPLEMEEDTVSFILSDNGASAEMMVRGRGHDPEAALGSAESFLCLGPAWSTVSNTPFRKHKVWAHEGGCSTPLIVHWPNLTSNPGEIRETPGHVIDLVPTILDLANVTQPKKKVPFPGQSLLHTFRKDSGDARTLWWSHRDNHAIRKGDWKLVKSHDGAWELFNMKEDRTETKNLVSQYPEKAKELKKLWDNQVEQIREVKKLH